MTLIGLRPKYTSTIVAVGTGMTIAFVATVVPLLTTPLARTAFFHLGEINDRINRLQYEADQLEKQTREGNIVVFRGQPLYDQFLIVTPQQTTAQRRVRLAAYFDAVVAYLNRTYVRQGLKPYVGRSSDPEIAKKLDSVLSDPTVQGYLLSGPVVLIAIADYNLFVSDRIQFTFAPYLDRRIFTAGEAIASVEVDGGTEISPTVAISELRTGISVAAIERKMPPFFADNALASATSAQMAAMQREIRAGTGRYEIVAKATTDVYVHTGGVPVVFQLVRPSAK